MEHSRAFIRKLRHWSSEQYHLQVLVVVVSLSSSLQCCQNVALSGVSIRLNVLSWKHKAVLSQIVQLLIYILKSFLRMVCV